MAIIVPAILENNAADFFNTLSRITKLPMVERIQVDFCDGVFVPQKTVAITDLDALNPAYVWEAHLMEMEPVDFLDYQILGFSLLIVHLEAFINPEATYVALKEIRRLGMKVGLAINPETPVESLEEFLPLVDQVTVLSVHPGMQGRAFLPESVDKVRALKEILPKHGILEIDGGIIHTNIRSVILAGADLVAVGSALLQSGNIQENFDVLAKSMDAKIVI